MKKGDLKKQEIMKTAETRFCRDGYEKTSIQDILDELHTSKGSFYHHFISKEALLTEICKNRAESTSESVFNTLKTDMNPEEKLNTLICGMIPFEGEKLNFLMMLIPVFAGTEGITIRTCYAEELEKMYLGYFTETIRQGTEEGFFACADAAFSAMILTLIINKFWLEICDNIFENETNEKITDPADLIKITENYRTSVERLLSAAYGSILLIRLPELKALTESIHLHWKK